MRSPIPKPAWFPALARRTILGTPRPASAPKPPPQWFLEAMAAYKAWYRWHHVTGGPRPAGVWVRVPSWASAGAPAFSPWVLAKEQAALEHHTGAAHPAALSFPTVPSKTKGRNGAYFYNPWGQIGEARWIQLLKEHGMWAAFLVHELDRAPMRGDQLVSDAEIFGIRDRLKEQGITVVATGWVEAGFDHDQQAQAAAHYSQGFDEYWPNAEASWAFPAPGFSAMDSFMPKLRGALGPKMPIGMSCLWGQQSHMRPFLEAGGSTVSPQCYMGEFGPRLNPKDALERLAYAQHDLPAGVITEEMVIVCYDKYRASAPRLEGFTAADDAAGRPARCAWAAEFLDEPEVTWLARG